MDRFVKRLPKKEEQSSLLLSESELPSITPASNVIECTEVASVNEPSCSSSAINSSYAAAVGLHANETQAGETTKFGNNSSDDGVHVQECDEPDVNSYKSSHRTGLKVKGKSHFVRTFQNNWRSSFTWITFDPQLDMSTFTKSWVYFYVVNHFRITC
jgi:hypothetical protein